MYASEGGRKPAPQGKPFCKCDLRICVNHVCLYMCMYECRLPGADSMVLNKAKTPQPQCLLQIPFFNIFCVPLVTSPLTLGRRSLCTCFAGE